MEKYNRDLFLNFKASAETYEKALKLTEKLGKLNTRMRDIFVDYKIPSRLFAFIESKYSSKIEGIYTTLFDVVNTGTESKQEEIIKPLVDALLNQDKLINTEKINKLAKTLNNGKDKTKRFSDEFGIWNNKTKEKIYEPPLDKKFIDQELDIFWKALEHNENNIIRSILFHLWFEKIHPFVDGNGRIGRLILNRKISELSNFSNLIPLSWSIYNRNLAYYDAFMFKDNQSLDESIRSIIDILLFMYKKAKGFILDLNKYYESYHEVIMQSSTKMNEEMCRSILFTLQTKQTYLIRKYKLNSRTVNNIFAKISEKMDFNTKIVGREKLFWNIEIETLINKWFGE